MKVKKKNTIPLHNLKLSLPIKLYSLSTRCAPSHHYLESRNRDSSNLRPEPCVTINSYYVIGEAVPETLTEGGCSGNRHRQQRSCLVSLTLISES